MKERLVRGELLVPIVKMVKSQRKLGPIAELGPWETDLLARRVAPTTWYGLPVFDSLLQVAHRFVLDGSEASARKLGVSFATADLQSEAAQRRRQAHLPLESAESELNALAARWRELFNFGEVRISVGNPEHGLRVFRVQIERYPDMSACLGHAIAGYVGSLVTSAGAALHEVRVDERPWMHNSVLTLVITCALPDA
jgi:hypothetical protein